MAVMVLNITVVMLAGSIVREDERLECRIAEMFSLSLAEKLRLQARRLRLLHSGDDLRSIRKSMGLLSQEQREQIGNSLLKIGPWIGPLNPVTVDKLTEAFRLLRLNPKGIFSGPTGVNQVRPSMPIAIDGTPLQSGLAPNQSIDFQKVAALELESKQASALLQSIFDDTDAPTPSSEAPIGFRLGGQQSEFVAKILNKEIWSRAELANIAAKCLVLLDGTIDAINDSALECYGDLLLEGHDPIQLNLTIAKELEHEYY